MRPSGIDPRERIAVRLDRVVTGRDVLYNALVSDGSGEIAALTKALLIVKDRLAADPSVFNEAAE